MTKATLIAELCEFRSIDQDLVAGYCVELLLSYIGDADITNAWRAVGTTDPCVRPLKGRESWSYGH